MSIINHLCLIDYGMFCMLLAQAWLVWGILRILDQPDKKA